MTMLRRFHPFGQELDDGVALMHMDDITEFRSTRLPTVPQPAARRS